MTAKMKRALAVYIAMVLFMTARSKYRISEIHDRYHNLSTFIFGLIHYIGMILLGFGCAGWFITEISRSKSTS